MSDSIPTENLPILESENTYHKGITIDTITNLKITYPNMTIPVAAKILDCSECNIKEHLRRHNMTWRGIVDDLDNYKNNRADIIAFKGQQIINNLTLEDIQKSSAYQKVGMYGVLFDKERLERGQSTANLAYKDMTMEIEELDREIAALEAELGAGQDDPEG